MKMGAPMNFAFCLLLVTSLSAYEATYLNGLISFEKLLPVNTGKDQFQSIFANISSTETQEKVANFLNYACEVMIVITNEAQAPVRLRCASKSSVAQEAIVRKNNSLVFTFKPHVDGSSDFWCNLAYQRVWAKFDAYTEDQRHTCPGTKRLYRYSVRHDGLYADPDIDGGCKIRALLKGHNEYTLWSRYDHVRNQADGQLAHAHVDGGMCAQLPDYFNNKAAAVSVCNHDCILVYDLARCKGPYKKLQAGDGCKDFQLDSTLSGKISAVKGC